MEEYFWGAGRAGPPDFSSDRHANRYDALGERKRQFAVGDDAGPFDCLVDRAGQIYCNHDHGEVPQLELQDSYEFMQGWVAQGPPPLDAA